MTNGSKRVLCVGEAMAELVLGNDDVPPAIGFAGDTMNTAVYLKRLLGENTELCYVTVIGNDTLSNRLLNLLEAESINTAHVERSDKRLIGLYSITTDEAGERTFNYWRDRSAARTLFQSSSDLDFSALSGAEMVYLSAISLAILPANVRMEFLKELDRLRKDTDLTVVFDSNYRPILWESQEEAQRVVAATYKITDIALPSIDDEQMLFDDVDEAAVLKRLMSYGIKRGALKRGEEGPLSLSSEIDPTMREIDLNDTSPVQVIDTTAAGDSFNAGYLSAVLSGHDEQAAMRAGHACSTRVIGHRGAIIPLAAWN